MNPMRLMLGFESIDCSYGMSSYLCFMMLRRRRIAALVVLILHGDAFKALLQRAHVRHGRRKRRSMNVPSILVVSPTQWRGEECAATFERLVRSSK